MKIYIVKDSRTNEISGSSKKKFFSSLGHIKTAKLWKYVLNGICYVEVYDLSTIEPEIITKERVKNLGL